MKRKRKKPAKDRKNAAQEAEAARSGESASPQEDGGATDGDAATKDGEPLSPADEKIAGLEAQVAELTDRLQRKTAEFANYQKRMRKETDETRRYAAGPMALEFLAVLDSFDRALDAIGGGEDDTDDARKELRLGLVMIRDQFRTALANHGVKPIEALGAPFDPNRHDAIMEEENPDLPDRTVMDELVKGYMHHDRLLRPARVRVARAPKPAEEEHEEEAGGADGAGGTADDGETGTPDGTAGEKDDRESGEDLS